MIVAATGHRPDKLGGYGRKIRVALTELARSHLQQIRPTEVIVGMALGWDQAVAMAALLEGIPFVAAVPFAEQANRWPDGARRRWEALIDRASRVEIISEFAGTRALHLRNKWMVDRAAKMLALWDGYIGGGTANCMAYVQQRRVPFVNAWDAWAAR